MSPFRVCAGERRRKVVCVRKSDHLEVSDRRCEHLPQVVAVSEPCNMDCEVRCGPMRKTHPEKRFPPKGQSSILSLMVSLRWHVAGKSECSAKCGSGYRSLDIQCVKYSLLKRQSERVVSSVCANAIKPRTRESCHGDCLLKSWQYGAWSEVLLTAAKRFHCSRLCFDLMLTSSLSAQRPVDAGAAAESHTA